MKKLRARPPLIARGSAEVRGRIETLIEPRPGTWSMLPAAAVRDRSLGPCSPLHVLAWLCKYRNTKSGECFPAVERMATDLGISARSVQRHIEKLIECGHVVVLPRRNNIGRQTSNQYFVLYGEVPASPDREEAPPMDEDATPTPKAPSGQIRAYDAGVTQSVTPGHVGVTQDVTPDPAETQSRGDTPCRGGVTLRVGEGDAQCHPNYPTTSIPLNYPSAEAVTRGGARDAAAAGQEPDGSEGTDEARIKAEADAQHDARQDVTASAVEPRKAPPRARDPVGDALRWISSKSGAHVGILWGFAMTWHEKLMAAGMTDQEAQDAIGESARLLEAFEEREGLVEKMTEQLDEWVASYKSVQQQEAAA